MQMQTAIPALPVLNVELSIPFYRDVLGLTMRHHNGGLLSLIKTQLKFTCGKRTMRAGVPAQIASLSVLVRSHS
jgi:hypothetical protein